MSTSTDDIKALKAAKDAASRVITFEAQLRERYAALTAEQQRLGITKSLEEVISGMEHQVDLAAQQWSTGMVQRVTGFVPGKGFVNPPSLPSYHRDDFDLPLLCALLPAEMKRRLEAAIRASGLVFGPGAAARAARLAEIQIELEAIERQHTELVDEGGITLPLLEVVRERRDAAATRARREELLAAERARVSHERGYEVR